MARVACQVWATLSPAARDSASLRLLVDVVRSLDVVHRLDQLTLREVQRVGGGQRRQQLALVHQVVVDDDLAVVARGGELAPDVAVADGDVEGSLVADAAEPPTRPAHRSVPSIVKKRRVSFSIELV